MIYPKPQDFVGLLTGGHIDFCRCWFSDLSEATQSKDRAVKTFLQPKNEQ